MKWKTNLCITNEYIIVTSNSNDWNTCNNPKTRWTLIGWTRVKILDGCATLHADFIKVLSELKPYGTATRDKLQQWRNKSSHHEPICIQFNRGHTETHRRLLSPRKSELPRCSSLESSSRIEVRGHLQLSLRPKPRHAMIFAWNKGRLIHLQWKIHTPFHVWMSTKTRWRPYDILFNGPQKALIESGNC